MYLCPPVCTSNNSGLNLLTFFNSQLFVCIAPADIVSGFNTTTYNASDTLKLSCAFTGLPIPVIEWLYWPNTHTEPIRLINENRTFIASYDITIFDGSGSGLDLDMSIFDQEEGFDLNREIENNSLHLQLLNDASYLVIEDLVHSDEGYYSCSAANGIDNHINAVNSTEAFVTVQSMSKND